MGSGGRAPEPLPYGPAARLAGDAGASAVAPTTAMRRERHRQRGQRPVERTRTPLQRPYRYGEFDVREPVEELLHRHRRDQPGLALRGAVVRARAPRQVGPVARPLIVRQGGVGVGGGQRDDERVACLQQRALVHHVPLRVVHGVVGHRRVGPQHLVEGVLDGQAAAGQVSGEAVVGQQQTQGVGDEVLLRLGARAHEDDEGVDHLLVREPRRVQGQPRRHVRSGLPPLQRDQLEERGGEQFVGPLGVHPVEDAGHALDQLQSELGRAAEEVVEDEQGQDLGVLAEEVGLAGGREPVDEGVGTALDVAAQGVGLDPGQAVGDGAAQPSVLLAVGEQGVGPVHHHRDDGTVRGTVPSLRSFQRRGSLAKVSVLRSTCRAAS